MQMTHDNNGKSSDKNDPEKPKRRTRKVVKKKEEKKEEELDDKFKNKIQKAIQRNLDDYVKRRNLSQKQIGVINSFIEEHLDCFILIGYSVDGDPVTLVNAPTPKDSDSLGTLIQKFLSKYTDHGPTGGMPPPQF